MFWSKSVLSAVFLTLVCCELPLSNSYAQPNRYAFTRQKMGSPFSIILYASDSLQACLIAENCFQLTDSLVNIYSDYIDSSELNRLCVGSGNLKSPFKASPALFDILQISEAAFVKSKGSFDITLGPVTQLWRNARKSNTWPTPDEVAAKLSLTGCRKMHLDPVNRLVILEKAGMKLDLGGIAQGYIAQQVINRIRQFGISNALVDVSGDITAIGSPPGKQGWTIAVNLPGEADRFMQRQLVISNNSVTTSGDTYQYMLHEGKKYSHVVNPATGYGLTSRRNVTVIAKDCTTADWLTKACSILPLKDAKRLAKELGAEFMIAEIRRETLSIHTTKKFSSFWKPAL